MRLSRRDAFRAGVGLFAAAGVAGCIEQRVTRRETYAEEAAAWALNPSVGAALDRDAFESFVASMEDRYGDSGVWGLESETPEDFETAYVQQLVVSADFPGRPTGSEASLDPDADLVDDVSPALLSHAAVATYAVGEGRYRYWLWAAADAGADEVVYDVDVASLSAGVDLRGGTLADAADVSRVDGDARVTLGSPPSARFPLADGTSNVEASSDDGGDGYGVTWRGDVDGAQSVNGVCEVERDGEHDFAWRLAAGYEHAEGV